MSEKNKSRSEKAKQAQTSVAREAREAQRGPLYVWLEQCFIAGMREKEWANRAEAARELTKEARLVSYGIEYKDGSTVGRVPGIRNRLIINPDKSFTVVEAPIPVLPVVSEPSRGYSRDLYNKLGAWEKQHGLSYPSAT